MRNITDYNGTSYTMSKKDHVHVITELIKTFYQGNFLSSKIIGKVGHAQ